MRVGSLPSARPLTCPAEPTIKVTNIALVGLWRSAVVLTPHPMGNTCGLRLWGLVGSMLFFLTHEGLGAQPQGAGAPQSVPTAPHETVQGRVEDPGPIPHHSGDIVCDLPYPLHRGWNFIASRALVHTRTEARLEAHELLFFVLNEPRPEGSGSSLESTMAHRTPLGLWVYAEDKLTLPLPTRLHPPTKPMDDGEAWRLLGIEKASVYTDSQTKKAMRWNGGTQDWQAVSPGQFLRAGEGVFVKPPASQHEVHLVHVDTGFFSAGSLPIDGCPGHHQDQGHAVPTGTPDPRYNYERALRERESLVRWTEIEPREDAAPYYYADYAPLVGSTKGAYQVEYQPHASGQDGDGLHEGSFEDLTAQDSRYLANFERVWAYTLGIALAQTSRETEKAAKTGAKARQALAQARYLCSRAVVDPQDQSKIRGWHFSWNTSGDTWKDARLVAGATAWAIHGLGVFLSSSAYQDLESEAEKAWFKNCYDGAVLGLLDHRRRLNENKERVSVMTAGWTTLGLAKAASPAAIRAAHGAALRTAGNDPIPPTERWSYYSVLDAIGYDHFGEPPTLNVCQEEPGVNCYNLPFTDEAWRPRPISQKTWHVLRTPHKSTHVVTEHNLDTLSVLNHALAHADVLKLEDPVALEQWRDELRRGLFETLWDDNNWIHEFEARVAGDLPVHPWIYEGLRDRNLGRVLTGGAWVTDDSGVQRIERSPHSAIDNCSWLSLSVDHRALLTADLENPGRPAYVDRLAQCLRYTVAQYAKTLGFENDAERYYGTHYFQNSFRDAYIAPSELQASSYHLEATMGLILGLIRFVQAHPTHPWAPDFRKEGLALWTEAQRFVRDHGFAYSSRRIHNLSTLLPSSTAILWYIDVFESIASLDTDTHDAIFLTSSPNLTPAQKTVADVTSWFGPDANFLSALGLGSSSPGYALQIDNQPILSLDSEHCPFFAQAPLPDGCTPLSAMPTLDLDNLPAHFRMEVGLPFASLPSVDVTVHALKETEESLYLDASLRLCDSTVESCATPHMNLAALGAQMAFLSTWTMLIQPFGAGGPSFAQGTDLNRSPFGAGGQSLAQELNMNGPSLGADGMAPAGEMGAQHLSLLYVGAYAAALAPTIAYLALVWSDFERPTIQKTFDSAILFVVGTVFHAVDMRRRRIRQVDYVFPRLLVLSVLKNLAFISIGMLIAKGTVGFFVPPETEPEIEIDPPEEDSRESGRVRITWPRTDGELWSPLPGLNEATLTAFP